MNISRIAIILALSCIGAQAYAEESQAKVPAHKTPIETYSYGSNLDIKKVIAVSDVGNECGPVPAQMTYEDSQGQRHVLQYQVMGNGCTSG
ncbi:hypothetical protein PS918_03384 [Pseudomonas fluorescens]|uniref:DUF2790 domain-containing protein n=1 Tax=Pseudomonas fluorescens TaxID=294 RepID=A0A5E7T0J2_PSEFL|nr:DUF2790 domain-containing protein [Pseudomonas fluorescens]VVP92561.1 hypothetical protein PS918_03384 [Pseudomonas fluorescens]